MQSDERESDNREAIARLRRTRHLSMYRSMLFSGCLVVLMAVYSAVIDNIPAAIFFGLGSVVIFVSCRVYRRGAIARDVWPEGRHWHGM